MSRFKVGDPVVIASSTGGDLGMLEKEGIIIEAGKRWDGVDLYVTDIPNNAHFGGLHRATDDELDLIPDTAEYTLENWSTIELLEELVRRAEKHAD